MKKPNVDQVVFTIMNQQADVQPERRLLWALIKRWIFDYTGICQRSRLEVSMSTQFNAIAWAWSDSTEPFSYLWVCDVLELDAEWLRRSADKTASRAELFGPLLGRIGSLEL